MAKIALVYSNCWTRYSWKHIEIFFYQTQNQAKGLISKQLLQVNYWKVIFLLEKHQRDIFVVITCVFGCQSFVTFVIGGFIYFSKDALCKLVWTVIGRTCNIQKVAMACQPQTNVSPTCQPQTNVSSKQMSAPLVNLKLMSAPLVSLKLMSAPNKCQPHPADQMNVWHSQQGGARERILRESRCVNVSNFLQNRK